MHKTRRQAENTIEVVSSSTFCQFGDEYLVTPGPRSGIERRTFHDLKDEDIKARSEEVNKIILFFIIVDLFLSQRCEDANWYQQCVQLHGGC